MFVDRLSGSFDKKPVGFFFWLLDCCENDSHTFLYIKIFTNENTEWILKPKYNHQKLKTEDIKSSKQTSANTVT